LGAGTTLVGVWCRKAPKDDLGKRVFLGTVKHPILNGILHTQRPDRGREKGGGQKLSPELLKGKKKERGGGVREGGDSAKVRKNY